MRNTNSSVKDRLNAAIKLIGDCKVDLIKNRELGPLYRKLQKKETGIFQKIDPHPFSILLEFLFELTNQHLTSN